MDPTTNQCFICKESISFQSPGHPSCIQGLITQFGANYIPSTGNVCSLAQLSLIAQRASSEAVFAGLSGRASIHPPAAQSVPLPLPAQASAPIPIPAPSMPQKAACADAPGSDDGINSKGVQTDPTPDLRNAIIRGYILQMPKQERLSSEEAGRFILSKAPYMGDCIPFLIRLSRDYKANPGLTCHFYEKGKLQNSRIIFEIERERWHFEDLTDEFSYDPENVIDSIYTTIQEKFPNFISLHEARRLKFDLKRSFSHMPQDEQVDSDTANVLVMTSVETLPGKIPFLLRLPGAPVLDPCLIITSFKDNGVKEEIISFNEEKRVWSVQGFIYNYPFNPENVIGSIYETIQRSFPDHVAVYEGRRLPS